MRWKVVSVPEGTPWSQVPPYSLGCDEEEAKAACSRANQVGFCRSKLHTWHQKGNTPRTWWWVVPEDYMPANTTNEYGEVAP